MTEIAESPDEDIETFTAEAIAFISEIITASRYD